MLSGLLQPRFQGKSTKWGLCAPVVLVFLILLSVRNAANTSRYQSHQISLENKYNSSSNAINNSDPTIITANHDEKTSKEKREQLDDFFDKETAIIVTTNLVPSHPALNMLNETLSSFYLLAGLSPNTQIYITVDQIATGERARVPKGKERAEKKELLEKYIHALYHAYEHEPNIHIIVNAVNLHIGGSFSKAISLLDPRTQFVYQVQQDFMFITEINHTAIVKTMREYPDTLRLVSFNKRKNFADRFENKNACWNQVDAVNSINGIHFTKTSRWSDNNHFSSVQHYKKILATIGYVRRPLEDPMLVFSRSDCSYWGPHYYGKPGEGPHLRHLDGRLGYVVPNSTQSSLVPNSTQPL